MIQHIWKNLEYVVIINLELHKVYHIYEGLEASNLTYYISSNFIIFNTINLTYHSISSMLWSHTI